MKKSIFIATTTMAILGLSAFTIYTMDEVPTAKDTVKTENEDFELALGTRFRPITKKELETANSFLALLDNKEVNRIESVTSQKIVMFTNERHTDTKSEVLGNEFSKEFKASLHGLKISDNFVIDAQCILRDKSKTHPDYGHFTPHFTLAPSQQASYPDGNEAFIKYIRTNIHNELLKTSKEDYKMGKLYFTISETGKIIKTKIIGTSGDKNIDAKILKLVKNNEKSWSPALNEAGEKIEQELVLSIGMIGC